LENESRTYRTSSIQQNQTLNLLKQEKQTMEQDKTNATNEMERLKVSNITLEQLLKSKQDAIVSLNRENQGNQQGTNEVVYTLKSPLQAKNNEIEMNNLKMENALNKEKEKNKKLQKENKLLKQQQQQTVSSRGARPSSSTTLPEVNVSSNATVPESTTSNTDTNEDDPNNDFNYDTECGAEYSSSDDTSSEDGDHANDLNYDSDV
jgi:hypothetical protein